MTLAIDADFPGGNIVLQRVDGDEVYLHQALRDTTRDWFYWCFRLRGAAGRRLTFRFTRSTAIGVWGPAISLDHGATWRWLGADCCLDNTFTYRFPDDADDLRLSMGMPYQLDRWQAVAARAEAQGAIADTLCRTRQGRAVPLLRIGAESAPARLLLTARHHACEMMPTYSLEGLADWLLTADEAAAAWLREQAQTLIVPFVDLDGVEAGDQGKAREPHDHNRDYVDGLYPETRALRQLVPTWSAGRALAALDLHCPWIRSDRNEDIYLAGLPGQQPRQRAFCATLEAACRGPLPVYADKFLAWGEDWNTPELVRAEATCAGWLGTLPQTCLTGSLELPYANATGACVDQESARLFGHDLGRALSITLQSQPSPSQS